MPTEIPDPRPNPEQLRSFVLKRSRENLLKPVDAVKNGAIIGMLAAVIPAIMYGTYDLERSLFGGGVCLVVEIASKIKQVRKNEQRVAKLSIEQVVDETNNILNKSFEKYLKRFLDRH